MIEMKTNSAPHYAALAIAQIERGCKLLAQAVAELD